MFSAVQPSGNLHIGNYLGAIKQWTHFQTEYEALFCIADLHAITVPQDPELLRKKTLEIAKIYLAAGIDPEQCTLFVQSQVKEHTELQWILMTLVKIAELERMTQFKDKSGKENREGIGAGLLSYPALMAADILLYDTAVVPVGSDQLQHVELTRTLGERFNVRFGETFRIPEARVRQEGARIMGLDDPTKKMSKSAASEYNFIALSDTPETIRKKIMKAVTDSGTEIAYTDEKPALKNLLNIYSLLSGETPEVIVAQYTGKGYGTFKQGLADVIVAFLTPFQERMNHISDAAVEEVIRVGAERARNLAQEKMRVIKEKAGLLADTH